MQEKHHTTDHGKDTRIVWTHIQRICRKKDNRLVKQVMFGMMEGEWRRERWYIEWVNDIMDV